MCLAMILKMIVGPQPLYVTSTLMIVMFITSIKLTVGDDNLKCIESERKALLSFKTGLRDSNGMLSSWRDGNEDCCHWRGVKCDNLTNHIIELDLHNSLYFQGLSGKIGNSIIELSHLRFLDLSYNSFYDTPIPSFIGSFANLEYLDLSNNWFSGIIPPHLGNLSSLRALHLSSLHALQSPKSLKWLSHLYSLQYLDLSETSLENARDWMEVINQLPHLEALALYSCKLPPPISPSYPYNNNVSTSLSMLNLAYNSRMTSLILPWMSNFSTNLVYLDLSYNYLQGTFSDLFPISPCCTQNSLQYLSLIYNRFSGPLPNFSKFLNLKQLDGSYNEFSGTIPSSLGKLSSLEALSLDHNSLEGPISEAHFSELTKLRLLNLGYNSLSFHLHSYWVPPFQLVELYLSSCTLGPKFPNWLRGQNLSTVDISNASISDTLPHWFSNFFLNLESLDLSGNKIRGELPTLFMNSTRRVRLIDLKSNEFEGQIPLPFFQAETLDVSNNQFSGLNFSCDTSTVPDCWGKKVYKLIFLSLANNDFSGPIPSSLSNLSGIQWLHLDNNRFSGEFPIWFKNFNNLAVLDLGGNNLSGPIPTWIGNNLSYLVHLSLRSNQFSGQLPSNLCHLHAIQFLDLSSNNISGGIPNCIDNLHALTTSDSSTPVHKFYSWNAFMPPPGPLADKQLPDETTMTWKGTDLIMKRKSLFLLKSIDLSGNHLTGRIPNEITNLVGLISLNLSRNNLMGGIPENIGQLKALDSLDLSRNELVGNIPSSLSQINRLGVLDLSYNKLSGKIPSGIQLRSFNASSYEGNTELCGPPLPKCHEEAVLNSSDHEDKGNKNEFLTLGFYISLALGFIVGFWGICGALIFNRSWRYAYFQFLHDLDDWFYIKKTMFKNRVQKLFKD